MNKLEMSKEEYEELQTKIQDARTELAESVGNELKFDELKVLKLNKKQVEIARYIIDAKKTLNEAVILEDNDVVLIGDVVSIEVKYDDFVDKMQVKVVDTEPNINDVVLEVSRKSPIGDSILGRKINSEVPCEINKRKTSIKILEKTIDLKL